MELSVSFMDEQIDFFGVCVCVCVREKSLTQKEIHTFPSRCFFQFGVRYAKLDERGSGVG